MTSSKATLMLREVREMNRLRSEGKSIRHIATVTGRACSTVRRHLEKKIKVIAKEFIPS